jgi:hypothetical protein
MSFLSFIKDMLSVVPALAVAFAAIGFVFVEVYLITRYGVHVINIDIRYLVIASAVGLLVFAVTAIIEDDLRPLPRVERHGVRLALPSRSAACARLLLGN